MAALNFSDFEAPLSASDPCGPDLDLEGDPAFMQYMAGAENALPPAYFERDDEGRLKPFDRSAYDFKAQVAAIGVLLARTRDLRLLALGGRLCALDRDLDGCSRCLALVADLLRDSWEEVHPRAEDGDYSYRIGVLQALDDMPTMILPLQHLPLFTNRRFGPISYRTVVVASGESPARDGEKAIDQVELERALAEAEPADLAAAREGVARLAEAARRIAAVTAEQAGAENAVRLDRVEAFARQVAKFLEPDAAGPGADAPAGEADGVAPVPGGTAAAALPPSGRVTSAAAAAAALAAVSEYFRRHEPSSPATLLVRQAERLIGLPFQEVIRALLPNHAEGATLYIGPRPEKSFQLRVDRIAEILGEETGERGLPSGADGDAPPPAYEVASRAGAVALLKEVAAFYRASEPSSPIPLFTDRACAMINQDFLSILSDVLPGVRLARESD
ncbi:hypothetical protein OPKNFCMD_0470 [Methylobacterium crusticola]|uniref:ImpA N-terminal domain-containing protein n=1 Tax=Methylobacterium crusticola TaxID=1697972 RepID=A0ABQ4QR29_9HYPH|nr:type VI secretion system ImpA family N-terminal domain-containing protein [Methylobacterium crusticola]GJD47760.1 hypothetical protein OPKNFCMD_0470 [Methylobacterium crusticola]